MRIRATLIVTAILLSSLTGCAAQFGEYRQLTTAELDVLEQQITATLDALQERRNRLVMKTVCTRLSWPEIVEFTGGDLTLINAIGVACNSRGFPIITIEEGVVLPLNQERSE